MNSLGFNKKEQDTKVVVAMSGGVDSSVAAVMLKKEGYNVIGVSLNLYSQSNLNKSKSCCAGKDIKDGAVIIDVGINRIEDNSDKGYNLVGDGKASSLDGKASAYTPVPGLSLIHI